LNEDHLTSRLPEDSTERLTVPPGNDPGFLGRQPKQQMQDTFRVRHNAPPGKIVIDPLARQTQNTRQVRFGTSLDQMGLNSRNHGIPQWRFRSGSPRVAGPISSGKFPASRNSLGVIDRRTREFLDQVGDQGIGRRQARTYGHLIKIP
jgi:hypothetical protein